jgi:hypothetical protein
MLGMFAARQVRAGERILLNALRVLDYITIVTSRSPPLAIS